MKRVLFLFNHDAAHQAAHIAGIMDTLSRRAGNIRCIAAVGSPQIEAELRSVISPDGADRIEWRDLSLPGALETLLALPNRIAPVRRLARLRRNQSLFASVDVLVSTERTCLRIRRRLRAAGHGTPKFVYVPHGSGDRNVAYHPELAQFDFMLLSGQKLVDEMSARRLASPENCHLIGYPKFDSLDLSRTTKLFDNDRPTFIYNPHFDPKLSSWYDHGPQLLRWFASQPGQQFNCVFAPHVMLFRKQLHISPEYRLARRRPEIPEEVRKANNILIDTDSPRLFDMTYTLSADAYIGDMSSQIYEFLIIRRPAFFIDTHSSDLPEEASNRAFWANGPVVRSVKELVELLPRFKQVGEEFRATQDRLFAYTIDQSQPGSSLDRAAQALEQILSATPDRADG